MRRTGTGASAFHPASVPLAVDAAIDAWPSLASMLVGSARAHADDVAFRLLGATLRYREVLAHADALAASLAAAGIGRGDRVALMLPNLFQHPVTVLAVLRIGAVVVNVNPLSTPRELGHQLRDSGAVGIVLLDLCARTLAAAREGTAIRHVVTTGIGDLVSPRFRGAVVTAVARRRRGAPPPRAVLPDAVPFRLALARGRRLPPVAVETGPDELAFLQYTGGTTGLAKGAMLTNRNLVANVVQATAWIRDSVPGAATVNLTLLPLYHVFSLTANLLAIFALGASSVLIPDPRDVDAIVAALPPGGVDAICGTGTLFARLLESPAFRRLDFGRLRLVISGGMALSAEIAADWRAVTGRSIIEGYGLTEASPILTINPVDRPRAGSAGLPVSSTRLRIDVDDAAEPASDGRERRGEVLAQGPQVMRGYWRNDAATRAAFDEAGWLRTGDVGVIDADGFLHIVERIKDLVIVGGFNVYPAEVEAVASAFPGVVECAAFGTPDRRAGERVTLVVRVADDAPMVDPALLAAHCRRALAAYKVPAVIEVTRTPLPRTPVGKVLKRELRDTARPDATLFVTRPDGAVRVEQGGPENMSQATP